MTEDRLTPPAPSFSLEPQRFYHFVVDLCGLAVLLPHHAEAAAVVPHGPADGVGFERGTDIANPVHPGLGVGDAAIGAEFVAYQGHVVAFGPVGCRVDFEADAARVPVVEPIAPEGEAIREVGNLLRQADGTLV